MAKYRITGPDGSTYEVNAPDTASEADVLAYAQQNFKPSASVASQPKPSQDATIATDRLAKGLRDPIDGGAQLLTNALPEGLVKAGNRLNNWLADKTGLVGRLPDGGVDQQVREAEAAYQESRGPNAGKFDAWRMGGNVATSALMGGPLATAKNATLGARLVAGGAGGAIGGALTPATGKGEFWDEKMSQTALGAAGGAVAPLAAAGVARVVSPNASTNANLALLQAEGVRPTIGQTLGGTANRIEERAMSIPILGDAIAAARGRAREQFNEAAINRATAPIGARATGTGQEAVRTAGDQISKAYDAARTALGSFQVDRQGVQEINRIKAMVANLPPQQQQTFNNLLTTIGTDISPNGTIPASVFKKIDSKIGQEAARFSGSADPYHQQLGDAFAALQQSIVGAGRRANPRADAMFSAADQAYANLVRVEGASKAAMNSGGVFTPGQLNMAVRQADRSVRDRATARGTALMQDLSNAGQSVLGNVVPNSGTADRLMLGGAGLGAYFVDPAIPASLLGGALMYTSPMQGLLRNAATMRPQSAQPVANALRQAAPGFGLLGGQVAAQIAGQY